MFLISSLLFAAAAAGAESLVYDEWKDCMVANGGRSASMVQCMQNTSESVPADFRNRYCTEQDLPEFQASAHNDGARDAEWKTYMIKNWKACLAIKPDACEKCYMEAVFFAPCDLIQTDDWTLPKTELEYTRGRCRVMQLILAMSGETSTYGRFGQPYVLYAQDA